MIETSNSGTACAIRSTTRNFNSFGTIWGRTAELAAYVYSLPKYAVNFHGIAPNLTVSGKGRFSGVDGWLHNVRFPQYLLRQTHAVDAEIPPNDRKLILINIPGVTVAHYWARVFANVDFLEVQLSAFVSAADVVTVVAHNFTGKLVKITGVLTVECGIA